MYIFQSEPVIKENCDSDLKITSLIFKSPNLNPMDYHAWVRYQGRYTPKTTNVAELKTALLSIRNDLRQEFTDKAILSFRKRLRFCVAAAGRHFEHSV